MRSPLSHPSPLLDVGFSYVTELDRPLTPDQHSQVRHLLQQYLLGLIPYRQCVTAFIATIGTSQPVDRLEAILMTPDVPLPTPFADSWLLAAMQDSRAKSHPWTAYEDQRLLAGIHRFGLDAWPVVAAFVGNGRTKAQCSQRWSRGLDPRISKDHWPSEQDERLVELVGIYGEKSWTRIASELGNRCDVQCRYRYKQLQKDPAFAEKYGEVLKSSTKKIAPPKPRKTVKVKSVERLVPQLNAPIFPGMEVQCGYCYPQRISAAVGFPPMMIPPGPPMQIPPVIRQQPAQPQPVRTQGGGGGPVIPPGNVDPSQLAGQAGFPPLEVPQISAQGSGFDWQNPFGLSPSGSLLGISPMNSFKFESEWGKQSQVKLL
jgi:hypothetical protein